MRVKGLIILAVLLHWTMCAEHRELYSSTDHLVKLVEVGKDLVKNLANYIASEESISEILKSVLQDLSKLLASVESQDELVEHVSNPLTAYKLVRNLKTKWRLVQETLGKSPLPEFMEVLKRQSPALPTDSDVEGIALGLLRLQDTYQLEPKSIMGRGKTGMVGTTSLEPEETLHIALVAYKNLKFSLCSSWMWETLRQLDLGADGLRSLSGLLQESLPLPPSLTMPQDSTIMHAVLQQLHSSTLHQSILQQAETQTSDISMDSSIPTSLFNRTYEALCRGQGTNMPPKRQRRLRCRYSHGGGRVPWLYAPVKEQDEWDSPPIIRYLNIISDQEIDTIKRLARPKLERAMVMDLKTGHKYPTESRVSKSAWLANEEDPIISKVGHRLGAITGLDMTMAESLQVANYGIGGQYEPHFDSKLGNDSDLSLKGNRIATILIYMSDIKLGGSTVFPDIGAEIKPQKGSAVVWYNFLRNGLEDRRTLHAACPVFIGSKWVANKWVRMRGQEFRRRCSLSPTE